MPEKILCMATGFGGGIGHTKNQCGAISGAVMAVGLEKGRKNPFGDFDSKPRKKNCMQIIAYCAGLTVKYTEK